MPAVLAPTVYGQPVLDTRAARRQASLRGYTLPAPTFRSACQRGVIPGAVTDGVHWRVPADAFAAWLELWIEHTQGK